MAAYSAPSYPTRTEAHDMGIDLYRVPDSLLRRFGTAPALPSPGESAAVPGRRAATPTARNTRQGSAVPDIVALRGDLPHVPIPVP